MNHLQHYLTKLAEEASEVAQIALKTQQFGPYEVMPGQPDTNFERCHKELDDLLAMVEELNEKFGFDYVPNRERIETKKANVRKYLGFSIHAGMVEGETDVCEHPMMMPLNGTKTHPLTAHALAELRDIAAKPVPRQAVNPGVANRLLREELVESVMLPSPFQTHKRKPLEHLRITDAGRGIVTPNDRVEGRDAASSRRVP